MYTTYTILNPSGNTTALVDFDSAQLSLSQRRDINDRMMSKHPEVEQVGFIYPAVDGMSLQMAGGEFCINASRAATYLYSLRSKQSTCKMSVSGYPGVVYGGVQGSLVSAKLTWPRPTIRMIDGYQIVDLPGISHVIVDTAEKPTDSMLLKKSAQTLMQRLGLQSRYPALGIMYVYEEQSQVYLFPVVYVRDIDTLIFETACGSGTIAASYITVLGNAKNYYEYSYIQPSGVSLSTQIKLVGSNIKVSLGGFMNRSLFKGRIELNHICT